MKSRLVLLLLAAHAGTALAQYKCTSASGAITFQQTACPGAQTEQKLDIVPNGHPPPASGVRPPPVIVRTSASASVGKVETNIDKRMLARYEVQHRREALEQALKNAQDDKAKRAVQRGQSLQAARRQFGDDPANAAALRDAVTAAESRYTALDEIDEGRIKSAQAALNDWNRAQAAGASSPAR